MEASRHPLKVAAVFALSAAIIFVRAKNAFLYPTLFVEDGIFFGRLLNNHRPDQLFFMYAGYRSILPNLVIYVALLAPFVSMAPYLMGLYCLATSAAACSVLALRRFRGFIADDNARCLACLALAALPLGDYVLQSNTVYSIWNWLFVLLALVAAPTSPSRTITALQALWSLLIIASHPLSALIVPFCGYALVRRPLLRDKLYHGALLAGVAAYLATSVRPQGVPGSGWLESSANAVFGLQLIFERVIFGGAFGNTLRLALNQVHPLAATAGGIGLAAPLLALAVRRRDRMPAGALRRLGLAALLIGGMTIVAAVSRNLIADRQALLFEPWSAGRYFYVQQMIVALGAMQVAYHCLSRPSRGRRGWRRREPAGLSGRWLAGTLWVAGAAAGACLLIWFNLSEQRYFYVPKSEGRRLMYFLGSLDMHIHDPAAARQPMTLNRGDVWSITYTGHEGRPDP